MLAFGPGARLAARFRRAERRRELGHDGRAERAALRVAAQEEREAEGGAGFGLGGYFGGVRGIFRGPPRFGRFHHFHGVGPPPVAAAAPPAAPRPLPQEPEDAAAELQAGPATAVRAIRL